MTATPSDVTAPRPARALRTILLAGLLAGALDIAYVYAYFRPADWLAPLRTIAAGLLGAAAVKGGGLGIGALGLALHFVIALGAAAAFYAASRKLPVLTRHAVVSGLLFGIAVYLVMNGVVLPLDANPPKAFPLTLPPAKWLPVFIAHLFCVGLPIALVVRRCAPLSPPAAA
jgi:hypothetical protein